VACLLNTIDVLREYRKIGREQGRKKKGLLNLMWVHICQFIYFLGNMIVK
jgi:hypothetical protein